MSEPFYSFIDSPNDILQDPIIIAPAQNEAQANMWSISIDAERARTTQTAEIVAFLEAVVASRDQQLRARYGETYAMLFYCWVDELAGQLRFSLISGFQPQPPFACALRYAATSQRIAEKFLHLSTRDGIAWTELSDAQPDKNAAETEPFILDIWVQQLPLKG